ncbi:hypothetical protein I79_026078 [Cricetulus griseus]|uniref:Uncharacterized protein n=1 Tax=Cricetulus griseus TaxID=10029 RepID=G3IPZ3_CRIGR|nr:hypothetical protein I79_026078 [Cricetulus griseus]
MRSMLIALKSILPWAPQQEQQEQVPCLLHRGRGALESWAEEVWTGQLPSSAQVPDGECAVPRPPRYQFPPTSVVTAGTWPTSLSNLHRVRSQKVPWVTHQH